MTELSDTTETPKPEIVKLVGPNSEATISSSGSRIQELRLGGIKILTSVIRGDGKEASSHPCFPNFGPAVENRYGKFPQHGLARDRNANLQIQQNPPLAVSTINLNNEFDSSFEGFGLTLSQFITLGLDTEKRPFFTLTTNSQNQGAKPYPVNFGEHFYFDTPLGWDGLKINGKHVSTIVRNNGFVFFEDRNTIEIPGKPDLILEQIGLEGAVLWAFKDPQTNKFDSHYICIEPVEGSPFDSRKRFGSIKSLIAPHSERKIKLTLVPA